MAKSSFARGLPLLAALVWMSAGMAQPQPVALDFLEAAPPPSHPETLPGTAAKLVTLPAAKRLLASSAGPAWRVFQVQAPKARQACQAAQRFAAQHKTKIACSALYHQTVVWLAPVQHPKAAARSQAHKR